MAAAAGETPPLQANYVFGRAWPDLNEGLSYTDTFRGADAETTATLTNFYSENYKSSAPLPGWIHRIRNGQITVDGQVVTDPDMILREGSKLVYHRLAWKEPFAPHLLQVLYEDDDMVYCFVPRQSLPKFNLHLILQKDVVTQPIGLVHYPGVAEGLYVACSSGKPAMSKVCVLERLVHQNQTLVQVEIHSGRPHQIRIHLAYIGHPLVDDPLYGIGGQPKFHDLESTSTDVCFAYDGGYERPLQPVPGDCGYHLHAHWLVLSHPTTNKVTASEDACAKDAMKESFVVEQSEPLANQKVVNAEMDMDSGEPKRKVVKRNSKLEKDRELLQLAQRYHGVVAERDAGKFLLSKM
ncbi:unnamed protein product [Triticum turgidum subsp. durum]|uniref:Pseudouridine synthase RsuA/RluA-like domain-containing protein n=1 Tax=Triticum turgidum subsp. durum TaxID=4567 RepID=A0A9R0WCX2_TRITD|nr:unnamed protein product [Triticum turgidum subsp. durum]